MAVPDYILNNFRWKAGALILAVFIWFLIQFAIFKGYQPSETPLTDLRDRMFAEQPVLVLTAPGSTQVFKITPASVDVTIRAAGLALSRLANSEVRVFVDLANATNGPVGLKEVLVQHPEGIEGFKIKVKPAYVTVERIEAP